MPQAAVAANMASAETAIQIAAGVSTRNGATRRAAPSAPSARRVTSTAAAVEAATRMTTTPATKPPPRPRRASTTKNSVAPGGWPATWVGQLFSTPAASTA